MRFFRAFGLILLLIASAAHAPPRTSTVHFKPIAFDRDNPGRVDFGPLKLLGAWRLSSNNAAFGGISSMRIDRGRVVAISDTGSVFNFSFDGRQSSSPLMAHALPRANVGAEGVADPESLTIDPATGTAWLGFENANSIQRYNPDLTIMQSRAAPAAMRSWPGNGGPEAIVRLSDGRFVVFSEWSFGPRGTEAILFSGDPTQPGGTATRFYYKSSSRYRATDAAELPDGRILVLNRRFALSRPIGAFLTIIDPNEIAPDKVMFRINLIRLEPPFTLDNMEALSVEQQDGKTVIWMASDDNFSPFQQTLLLKFQL
jgi:hypothetical protein